MDEPRRIAIRSYRDVVDVVERRIYRVDQWRIPSPAGMPAAAVAYFIAGLAALAIVSQLPIAGGLLGLIPASLRFLGIPILGAWALCRWQVDGRRPHYALWAWLREALGPRTLAGLRRTPSVGTRFAPVDAITIAPSGDAVFYRAGRVRGPATVVLRYPARIEVESWRRRAVSPTERVANARRLRVRGLGESARPLLDEQAIRIPEGGEVIFE